MWSKRVLIIFILCTSNLFVFGKRFDTRCKLVRELIKVGFPNDIFLGQWVCLIEQVSQKDTSKLKQSPSGKKFYGLFQIPARWCNEGKRRGICDVDCQALLDDDIHDDAVCANKIFKQEGFKFWSQWENRCKNNHHYTTEIYKCADLQFPRTSPDRLVANLSRHKRTDGSTGLESFRIFRYLNLMRRNF